MEPAGAEAEMAKDDDLKSNAEADALAELSRLEAQEKEIVLQSEASFADWMRQHFPGYFQAEDFASRIVPVLFEALRRIAPL